MHRPLRRGLLQPAHLGRGPVAGPARGQRRIPLPGQLSGQLLGPPLQRVGLRRPVLHVLHERLPGPLGVRRLPQRRPVRGGEHEAEQQQPDGEDGGGPLPSLRRLVLLSTSRRGVPAVKVIREQLDEQRSRHVADPRTVTGVLVAAQLQGAANHRVRRSLGMLALALDHPAPAALSTPSALSTCTTCVPYSTPEST